jgi:hypothetical protein
VAARAHERAHPGDRDDTGDGRQEFDRDGIEVVETVHQPHELALLNGFTKPGDRLEQPVDGHRHLAGRAQESRRRRLYGILSCLCASYAAGRRGARVTVRPALAARPKWSSTAVTVCPAACSREAAMLAR